MALTFYVPFSLAMMDARGFTDQLSIEVFSSITNFPNILNSCLEYIFVFFVEFVIIYYLIEGVCLQSTKLCYEVGIITNENVESITTRIATYAMIVLFVAKVDAYDFVHKTLGDKVYISTTTSTRGDIIYENFIINLIQGFYPNKIMFWIFL